jgi:hypothetical protein
MTSEMIENRIPLLTRPAVPQQRVPTTPPVAAPPVKRHDRLPLYIAILFVALVAAGAAAMAFLLSGDQPTGSAPMGLTPAAWQEYRTGERVTASDLARADWLQYRTGERVATVDLTQQNWQSYRSGERATDLTQQNWIAYRAGERVG